MSSQKTSKLTNFYKFQIKEAQKELGDVLKRAEDYTVVRKADSGNDCEYIPKELHRQILKALSKVQRRRNKLKDLYEKQEKIEMAALLAASNFGAPDFLEVPGYGLVIANGEPTANAVQLAKDLEDGN